MDDAQGRQELERLQREETVRRIEAQRVPQGVARDQGLRTTPAKAPPRLTPHRKKQLALASLIVVAATVVILILYQVNQNPETLSEPAQVTREQQQPALAQPGQGLPQGGTGQADGAQPPGQDGQGVDDKQRQAAPPGDVPSRSKSAQALPPGHPLALASGPSAAPSAPPITPSGPPGQIVAKVNGTQITRGQLDFTVKNINGDQGVPAEKQAEFRRRVLDEMIDRDFSTRRRSRVRLTLPTPSSPNP